MSEIDKTKSAVSGIYNGYIIQRIVSRLAEADKLKGHPKMGKIQHWKKRPVGAVTMIE